MVKAKLDITKAGLMLIIMLGIIIFASPLIPVAFIVFVLYWVLK